MEQHPIPQNVTAYEFHLIGNMTVKQFVELGGGILLAVIIYGLSIPTLFKWPLIILFAAGGAAIAFLPFDGRPLDRMVIVFFRAVYNPTQFIWRKTPQIPAYFTFTAHRTKLDPYNEEKQRLRKNINEYLSTLPDQPAASPIETQQLQLAQDITQMFDQVSPAANVNPSQKTIVTKTSTKPRIRKLKEPAPTQLSPSTTTPATSAAPTATQTPTSQPANIIIPQTQTRSVPTYTPDQLAPKIQLGQALPYSQAQYNPQVTTTTQATQNKDLPFPSLPDQPNLVVGMVLDSNGKIVENAIVEIKDHNHLPIRALKTNRLGQFFSATPLKSGHYEVEIEKDNLQFNVLSLDLNGKIVPPLEIRSQNPLN